MKVSWKTVVKIIAQILLLLAGGAGGGALFQVTTQDDAGVEITEDGTVKPYGEAPGRYDYIITIAEQLPPASNPALPEYKLPDGFKYQRFVSFHLTTDTPVNEKMVKYYAKRHAANPFEIVAVCLVDKFYFPLQPAPGEPVKEKPEEKNE